MSSAIMAAARSPTSRPLHRARPHHQPEDSSAPRTPTRPTIANKQDADASVHAADSSQGPTREEAGTCEPTEQKHRAETTAGHAAFHLRSGTPSLWPLLLLTGRFEQINKSLDPLDAEISSIARPVVVLAVVRRLSALVAPTVIEERGLDCAPNPVSPVRDWR